MIDPLAIAGGAVALVAGGAALRKIWQAWRKVSAFIDELTGEPAMFGREPKPGLVQRMDAQVLHNETVNMALKGVRTEVVEVNGKLMKLSTLVDEIHHELHPNSGLSLRDAVDRTEAKLAEHIRQAAEQLAAGTEAEGEIRQALTAVSSAVKNLSEEKKE